MLKFMVTLAPAGTVMLVLSKARLRAIRSTVTAGPEGGDVVGVGVGEAWGGNLAGSTTNQNPFNP